MRRQSIKNIVRKKIHPGFYSGAVAAHGIFNEPFQGVLPS
jgi:hypothetical protein